MPTNNVSGLSGDGGDWVTVTRYANLEPAQALTVECIIQGQAVSVAAFKYFLSKLRVATPSTDSAYAIYANGSADLAGFINAGGTFTATAGVAAATAFDNNPHRVSLTYDGTNMRFYFDGALQSTTAHAVGGNIDYGSNLNLFFLAAENATANAITATVDDVRVWNVVRTVEQIRAAMFQRLRGNETGLVGYWKLDENTGTNAANAVTGGNVGTLAAPSNTPTWTTSVKDLTNADTFAGAMI